MKNARKAFPIDELAANGLRRGRTTGSCATAAVKAALLRLLCDETAREVRVNLPDGTHYLDIPIERIQFAAPEARAWVIKDGGDDPDQTHRAAIIGSVRKNELGIVRFHAGEGVGKVTQPGLLVPVGEAAINPVPRQMMKQAVEEVLTETGLNPETGFDLQISCVNGEQIARRTFNPRLGVHGGISILGTTGIVEPKSLASFKASIEIYLRVAVADDAAEIVLAPGNLGQRFARATLGLPLKRIVQMSNFVGFSLDTLQKLLCDADFILPKLWLVGHPGKLAKLLDDQWDTHSNRAVSCVPALCRVAEELHFPIPLLERMRSCVSAEAMIDGLRAESISVSFWNEVERRIRRLARSRLLNVADIKVKLFEMNGRPLGFEDDPARPLMGEMK